MKRITIILMFSIVISCSVNRNPTETTMANCKVLIGTWTYIDTKNKAGIALSSYETETGKVKATGPEIIFYSNGTYEKIYTIINPNNIKLSYKSTDTGKWKYNKRTMTIDYDLVIDNTDIEGQDLINRGLAVKQADGKYYERVEDKIIKLDNEELIIVDENVYLTFKKIKNGA